MTEGVNHKELNDALDSQADRLISKMNRMEDSIKDAVREVKADCEKDKEQLDRRITKLEDSTSMQKIWSGIIAALTALATAAGAAFAILKGVK